MNENVSSGKNIVKTYFITNTLESTFPPEFVAARGKKYIVVRYCCATIGEEAYQPYDLALHASFIMRDAYMDHFVDICNVIDSGSKPSKYLYPENGPKTFKVWFTTITGDPVDLPIDFVLKLLLIYEC